ncbi:metalloendopeptidase-like protein [Thermochaetoides thermophila DSM 1495]|uniref:Metalloendopeptidase-like protein n=1 Tax=Chaetomium thermophilum (strain DSM 1495 / CBS 144.50 / IMI 039719) TaxID=759272 RepID=G0SEV1_CHATD|nr:metalloendopeptidase-like protein [Thermochaetoides thermophila DSM 1495]EGS17967.1 metalloendopeptidase-like protein [Thermochaetoides thermophila DSM 1495]
MLPPPPNILGAPPAPPSPSNYPDENNSSVNSNNNDKSDWEDWTDNEIITTVNSPRTNNTSPQTPQPPLPPTRGQGQGQVQEELPATPTTPWPTIMSSPSRNTNGTNSPISLRGINNPTLKRLRSRQRQKAQNARAGIKLVTDLSKLQPPSQQQQGMRTGKFVDLAALKALEGRRSPLSGSDYSAKRASYASWMKRRPTYKSSQKSLGVEASPATGTPSAATADLSPYERRIPIGIEIPPGQEVVVSPETAVVETPPDLFPRYLQARQQQQQQQVQLQVKDQRVVVLGQVGMGMGMGMEQRGVMSPEEMPKSCWSPDTEDMVSPQSVVTERSPQEGLMERVFGNFPFPNNTTTATTTQPTQNAAKTLAGEISPLTPDDNATLRSPIYDEDDDTNTPVTLFEEDGQSPATTRRRSLRAMAANNNLTININRQRSGTSGSADTAARSPQGWWDQIRSPFFGPPTPVYFPGQGPSQTQMPAQVQAQVAVSVTGNGVDTRAEDEWWKDDDKKKQVSTMFERKEGSSSRTGTPSLEKETLKARPPPQIVVEDHSSSVPTPGPTPMQEPPSSSELAKTAALSHPPEKPPTTTASPSVPSPTPSDLPPPYSPPRPQHPIPRYRLIPLPSPSPSPSPGLADQTISSQRAPGLGLRGGNGQPDNLSDIPLTPNAGPTAPGAAYYPGVLPDRPQGSFVPAEQSPLADVRVNGRGPWQSAERKRRRHEKEDAVAYRAGRMWHGRGCFPLLGGCCGLGRPGREGRKRRRFCCCGALCCLLVLMVIILGVVLGTVVFKKREKEEEFGPWRWVNLTDFPAMPVGRVTVVGPEEEIRTGCVQPSTLWSCAIPKEEAQAGLALGFESTKPAFVFEIEVDEGEEQAWNVPNGETPTPVPLPASTSTTSRISSTGFATVTRSFSSSSTRATSTSAATDDNGSLVRRQQTATSPGEGETFIPSPPAPPFQEIFFLGNTTDGVVSPDKGGEPTPFYITLLRPNTTTPDSPSLTRLARRQATTSSSPSFGDVIDALMPPPHINPDGTAAPPIFLPTPQRQPLRLFDRGLPTERFAFYSYFNKTIYVREIGENGPSPDRADLNGGCLREEAKWVVAWHEVRIKVEIWTRRNATARLVNGARVGSITPLPATLNETEVEKIESTQPGTAPYPVTVTLDTHGGEVTRKIVFARRISEDLKIQLSGVKLIRNEMNNTGDLVNPGASEDANPSFGGFDGGTGGCRCTWRNFIDN